MTALSQWAIQASIPYVIPTAQIATSNKALTYWLMDKIAGILQATLPFKKILGFWLKFDWMEFL